MDGLESQIREAVKASDYAEKCAEKAQEAQELSGNADVQMDQKIHFIENLSKPELDEALKLLSKFSSKDRWSFLVLKDRLIEQLEAIEDSE
jgi:hypothetical protein